MVHSSVYRGYTIVKRRLIRFREMYLSIRWSYRTSLVVRDASASAKLKEILNFSGLGAATSDLRCLNLELDMSYGCK